MTVILETALAAVGAGVYAGLVEPRRLVVRRHRVPWPAWRSERRPLRLVLFSDLHASWPHMTARRIGALVRRVLAERPALVLIAGDFMCTDTVGTIPLTPETVARALRPLARQVPTFAVLGNHDWDFDGARVVRALEDAGVTVLVNSHRGLRFGGAELRLAGVDDPVTRRADLARALEGVVPEEPVVLLSHSPDLHRRAPHPVRLLLAGHTHGGQIRLPGIGALVTMSRLPRRFARGLHRDRGRHLLVTAGVGTTGIPLRFACPPELVVLELVPSEPERPGKTAVQPSTRSHPPAETDRPEAALAASTDAR